MGLIKQRRGWLVSVVADQRGGWGAAGGDAVGPTREVSFNFRIESDAGGYLLVYAFEDSALYADTWHETLAAAERAALEEFGIPHAAWEPGSE